MATRVRAGRSDKTVMGASRTGSYEVTATRPDVREDATGHGRQISAKTARRRSLPRVRPRPMAPQTSSLSLGDECENVELSRGEPRSPASLLSKIVLELDRW